MMKYRTVPYMFLFFFTASLFCRDTDTVPDPEKYRFDSSGRVRSWGTVRLGPEGFTDVQDDTWVMKRFDSKGRPKQRIMWVDGLLSEKSDWEWNPDGSIVTTIFANATKQVALYTHSGLLLSLRKTDPEGILIFEQLMKYNDHGDIIEAREKTAKRSRLQINEYTDDNVLKYTRIEINGLLSLERHYSAKQDWQEIVYYRGRPVLQVQYRDAVRTTEREIR